MEGSIQQDDIIIAKMDTLDNMAHKQEGKNGQK